MKWSPLTLLLTFPFHSSHQAQEPQTWWKVPPGVSERQIHHHSTCSWSWKWRTPNRDGVRRVLINTYLSMWRTFFPDTESIPKWFDLQKKTNNPSLYSDRSTQVKVHDKKIIRTWENALREAGSQDNAVILLIHGLAVVGLWKAKFTATRDH